MPSTLPFVATALLGLAAAQHVGEKPEVHPRLTTYECTKRGGCVAKNSAIVLDALSHPVYQVDNPELGCGEWGNAPNKTVCPDAETCQKNCVMQGVDDYAKYGVSTHGSSLRLDMLADDGSVLTPRVYLLSEDEQTYEMLSLTGKEFTFDVDVSKLPCGMNGALYLSEMPADGGLSDLNKAGAYYGTGYCDAQCYATPFIAGEPNIDARGSCCPEHDIWEANARSSHIAPHPCDVSGLYLCEGDECEFDGVCDKNGCAYNAYRLSSPDYYGLGLKVDTTRPFTVVSQFPADKNGVLTSYRRLYIQDGKIIDNSPVTTPDLPKVNYINDELCEATGSERYMDLGATKGMGEALTRGMVLAMSIWWGEGGMTWLDTDEAGPCKEGEGEPDVIRENQPDTEVTFSNIKWGEIGSTFKARRKPGHGGGHGGGNGGGHKGGRRG